MIAKMTGDKKLERAFRKLGREVQGDLLIDAGIAAAQPVLRSARANVESRSGRLAAGLRIVIVKKPGEVGAAVRTPTRAKLGIAKDAKYYYPAHLEFGHVLVYFGKKTGRRVAPHPFLIPALDDNRAVAQTIFEREIWAAIRRRATRLAKGA